MITTKQAAAALMLPLTLGTQSVGAQGEEDGGLLAEGNFSSTITFTSDYVFRGISFSGQEPALQGTIGYAYEGFFVGVFGSSLKGEDGLGDPNGGFEVEFDYYGGYANSLGPIDYELLAIYFNFPGAEDAFGDNLETDQFEAWLTLGHTFADLPLEPNLSVRYSYSPDFTLEDGNGHYVRGTAAFTLPAGFGVDAYVGYQTVEGDEATGPNGAFATPGLLDDGYSYLHWSAGITKELIAGFSLDLRYHDTNEDDDTAAFYGAGNIDDRFVVGLTRAF